MAADDNIELTDNDIVQLVNHRKCNEDEEDDDEEEEEESLAQSTSMLSHSDGFQALNQTLLYIESQEETTLADVITI